MRLRREQPRPRSELRPSGRNNQLNNKNSSRPRKGGGVSEVEALLRDPLAYHLAWMRTTAVVLRAQLRRSRQQHRQLPSQ